MSQRNIANHSSERNVRSSLDFGDIDIQGENPNIRELWDRNGDPERSYPEANSGHRQGLARVGRDQENLNIKPGTRPEKIPRPGSWTFNYF